MIEIGIYPDYVVIEGVRIDRPGRISRSAWVDFWERAVDDSKDADQTFGGY